MSKIYLLDCFWLLDALLDYTATGHVPSIFTTDSENKIGSISTASELPQRMDNNHLYRYSKVLGSSMGFPSSYVKPLPTCPHLLFAKPIPLNKTAPT